MSTAGLTLTRQAPASAIATVEVGDRTPTDLWGDLARTEAFQTAVVESIRVSATGKRPNEFREDLVERDLPTGFDDLAVRVASGDKRAVFSLLRGLARLGEGWTTTEDVLAAPRLLEGGDSVPTVAFRLRSEFFDRRADQRRDVCGLIAALARTCDVRLVGTGLVHRRLAELHREDLPGVSEQCNAHREEQPLAELVESARATLDFESTEVRLLRELADDSTETLSYHALEATLPVSDSRIRQVVSRLTDLSLVDRFDGASGRTIELLEGGREFLNVLDSEIGRQRRLDECVSETGKACIYSRVSQTWEGEEGTGPTDRRRLGEVVDPTYMPRWRHAAATASATDGGLSLVDHPEERSDELRQPYLSYDDGGDRLVVGAEYTNPMQYWVSVARALTDRRVWADVLTPERLDGDLGNLAGLETDDTRILRDARCLGWLKDADAHGEGVAEALMDAESELCDLLRRLANEDYEDRNEFRGLITREALGIAGTVAHLCDLADVELVRELRLGEFSRTFDADRRADLVETITRGVSIASRHGHFAAYRQLFEDREEKRAAAMSPSIPADNPTGAFIGSLVIVGDTATSLEEPLQSAFSGGEPHEDAPEFEVDVPIRTTESRESYVRAISDVLEGKAVRTTRAAVSLLHALAGTVYDAANALGHSLQAEEKNPGREIRLDEVRRALAALPQQRLMPEMKPTIRKTTKALLETATPLSRSELADRAGVSTRSLRDHFPRLEALGLVEEAEAGYRFTLPFPTAEERDESIVPAIVTDVTVAPADALYELGAVVVGDDVHDPETEVGGAFFVTDPVERLEALRDVFGEWATLTCRLAGVCTGVSERTASFGATPQQAPLPTQEVAT